MVCRSGSSCRLEEQGETTAVEVGNFAPASELALDYSAVDLDQLVYTSRYVGRYTIRYCLDALDYFVRMTRLSGCRVSTKSQAKRTSILRTFGLYQRTVLSERGKKISGVDRKMVMFRSSCEARYAEHYPVKEGMIHCSVST